MVSFSSLFLGLGAVAGVLATPVDLVKRPSLTSSKTGTDGGFYYSFYTDGKSDVVYTNEGTGKYSVKWSGSGDFTSGKGWNPGSAQ